jgi:hypothetical protein
MVPSSDWGKGLAALRRHRRAKGLGALRRHRRAKGLAALRRHRRASGIMDLRHTRLLAPGDLGYDTLWDWVRAHGMEGGTR